MRRRQNHNSDVVTRIWLYFSPASGHVYCFTCRLMCSDKSQSQSLVIGSGICNWKHALERLRGHEQSKENTDAFTAFHCRFKMACAIDDQMEEYWKSVLEHAVSVMKFIAERGLAFRGDSELLRSPGNRNYFGTLEFIARCDIAPPQHCQNDSN